MGLFFVNIDIELQNNYYTALYNVFRNKQENKYEYYFKKNIEADSGLNYDSVMCKLCNIGISNQYVYCNS